MIVVKVGGSEGIDYEALCDDAAAIIRAGEQLVIVHGGSHQTNVLGEQLGHPARFITSPSGHTSRRTDRRTLEIFQMACRGVLNQRIVEGLVRRGIGAVGLSGLDGRLWEGTRKSAIRAVEDGRIMVIRDDYTGTVDHVNARLLRLLLDSGFIPVISPPAVSAEGEAINVDADRAAARTAAALQADTLLLLTNVPGLMREFPDESTLVPTIRKAEIAEFERIAEGRMKKKLLGAREAMEAGVRRVVIAGARKSGAISGALAGAGTVFS